MFGLGLGELALIAVAALVILGPERLPGLLRQIARFIRELRRVTELVRQDFDSAGGGAVGPSQQPRSPPAGVWSGSSPDASEQPLGLALAAVAEQPSSSGAAKLAGAPAASAAASAGTSSGPAAPSSEQAPPATPHG